ncbi:MAG: ABC transporter permease, partial [Candidatus Omnitrophota bacterium]
MNVLRIALNDLRRILKNRMILFWWLAMPLGFVFFFGGFFNDPNQRSTWMPIFNRDPHELSRLFIDQLRTNGYSIDVRSATETVFNNHWAQAVIIPATFSADLLAGKKIELTFLPGNEDPERVLAAQARLIHAIVKFTGALAETNVAEQEWSDAVRDKFKENLAKPQPLTIEEKKHSSLRPPPIKFAFALPSYLIMFVMMNTIMAGGLTLTHDRMLKQLARLMCAPVSPSEIFMGKILGNLLQPALQSVLLLAAGYYLFDVPLGDHPLALIPVLLCLGLFCGAFGLLAGSICSTEQQISSLGMLSMMLLSA